MISAKFPLTPEAVIAVRRPVGTIERRVRAVFEQADIAIGSDSGAQLRVRDPRFFRRIAANPAYELGQTYVDGLWDCERIDRVLDQLLRSGIGQGFEHGWRFQFRSWVARIRNLQSRLRASMVADRHYDFGDDWFEAILDPSMAYTCAIWNPGETTLEGAQRAKFQAVCEKLEIAPGSRLLDIGCGWGGLLEYAADRYGVRPTGITISRNQAGFASRRLRRFAGAQVHLKDYREMTEWNESFDEVASVEMIEAVGPKNFRKFMELVHQVMRPGGRFLLQSFISHRSVQVCNEWFDRNIFPNGVSPSLAQLAAASESTFGSPVQIDNIGLHYDPTLMAWDANLLANWDRLAARGYRERDRRTWHFYLQGTAGVFRAEHLRIYQLVYRKNAWPGVQ
jgi:cyclopropane-fatty-acyl-phospholipid synthase